MTTEQAERFVVGSPITDYRTFRDLPVGTVVRYTHTSMVRDYTKQGNNDWAHSGGESMSDDGFVLNGANVIHSLPGVQVSTEQAGDEVDTTGWPDDTPQVTVHLHTYLAEFRAACTSAAAAAGINSNHVTDALNKLAVPQQRWLPGMTVQAHHGQVQRDLPDGTVLRKEGDTFQSSGVWGKEAGFGWRRLTGGGYFEQAVVIVSIPGEHGQWVETEPTMQDAVGIAEFKRRAWMVGLVAKRTHRWCAEFERAFRDVGIDGSTALTGGRFARAEQVAALPEGSVLRYVDDHDSTLTVLMVRDDTMTNPARTRRIGGALTGDWAAWSKVEWTPDDGTPLNVVPFNEHEAEAMPDGTVWADGESTWEWNAEVQRWQLGGRGGYNNRSGDFTYSNTLTYTRFGPA